MKTRVIVSAMIEHNGKILFGKKPLNRGPYPNTLHLLGGGVKEGESIVSALQREVMEEAGITLKNIRHFSFSEDYEPDKHGVQTHYIFLVFRATYKSGKLKPSDDITELIWVDKAALTKVALNRPTIKLFKELKMI